MTSRLLFWVTNRTNTQANIYISKMTNVFALGIREQLENCSLPFGVFYLLSNL